MATLTELKRSQNSIKGKVTLVCNLIETYLNTHFNKPAPSCFDYLNEHRDELRTRLRNLEEVTEDILSHGDDDQISRDLETYSLQAGKQFSRMDEFRDKCDQVVHERAAELAKAGRAPTPTLRVEDDKVKAVAALKPFTLNADVPPPELRNWLEEFEAYYEASHLEKASVPEQQHYLYRCLEKKLSAKIKLLVRNDTPIFGDADSCLKAITDEIMQKWPLFIRRVRFFRRDQKEGETFTQWRDALITLAREADLNKVNEEALMCMRYVSGCKDHALRTKFLELTDPKEDDLVKLALAREAAKTHGKELDNDGKSKASSAALSAYKRAKSGRAGGHRGFKNNGNGNRFRGDSRNRSSSRPRATFASLKNKCYGCGKPASDHSRPDCPYKNVVCKNCGKTGHGYFVCLKDAPKAGNSASSSSNVNRDKRGRTRSRSRGRSRSKSRGRSTSNSSATSLSAYTSAGTNSAPDDDSSSDEEDGPSAPIMHLVAKARGKRGVPFKITGLADTGSEKTIISLKVAQTYGIVADKPFKKGLRTACSADMPCVGTAPISLIHKGIKIHTKAILAPNLVHEILVGWKDLKRLKVLADDFPGAVIASASLPELLAEEEDDSSNNEKPKKEEGVKLPEIQKVIDSYKDVFDVSKTLQPMKGPPMDIHLRDDIPIVPTRVLRARKVPLHQEKDAQELLDKLIADGVLEKAEGPSDWISPSMFVAKPKGGVRLVTDFSGLNKYVRRPNWPFPTPNEVMTSMSKDTKYFCALDARHGYFQVKLSEKAKQLTTTMLPQGRYRYCRAPQGCCSSSDEYCARTDTALAGLKNVHKIIDDILVTASSVEELAKNVTAVLQRCRENGITLSPGKVEAGKRVKFAGFVVSDTGVEPDNEKVAAIKNFPRPQNITDLRSYFGLVNQLGGFVPDLAHALQPLRSLLKKDTNYQWQPEHTTAFEESKAILTSPLIVHHFDPTLPTELLTDASRLKGLGYLLIQRDKQNKPRLICCGSRSLQPVETRYATIEIEALALVFAVLKCSHYLKSMPRMFTIMVDHRPLKGIWKKAIDEVENPRLQRLMNKVAGYNFEVDWVPGAKHAAADCLSRMPLWQPQEEDVKIASLVATNISDDPRLTALAKQALDDQNYQRIILAFQQNKNPISLPPQHPARAYASIWDEISLQDGLLCVGKKIIVPDNARKDILQLLHISHPGLARMREIAHQLYFFPGMNNSLKTLAETCEQCQRLRPVLPPEPLLQTTATYPMEMCSIDLASGGGNDYLVMVDRYSGYIFAAQLHQTSTKDIIKHLKRWMFDFGMSKVLRSDGGPQFRSEFNDFCDSIGATHELSSAQYPRSNGHAEAAVKQFKQLAEKCEWKWEAIQVALREHRNIPRSNSSISPAEAMFGRKQRTLLPMLPSIHQDQVADSDVKQSNKKNQNVRKISHDKTVRLHKPLSIGQKVRIYDYRTHRWDGRGVITRVREKGRSYHIDDGSRILLRNRRFISPIESNSQNSDVTLDQQVDGNEDYGENETLSGLSSHENLNFPKKSKSQRSQRSNIAPKGQLLRRSERLKSREPARSHPHSENEWQVVKPKKRTPKKNLRFSLP